MYRYFKGSYLKKIIIYHHNDKIQPTPSICKIFDEPESQPFDTHFQKENHSKNSVHVI